MDDLPRALLKMHKQKTLIPPSFIVVKVLIRVLETVTNLRDMPKMECVSKVINDRLMEFIDKTNTSMTLNNTKTLMELMKAKSQFLLREVGYGSLELEVDLDMDMMSRTTAALKRHLDILKTFHARLIEIELDGSASVAPLAVRDSGNNISSGNVSQSLWLGWTGKCTLGWLMAGGWHSVKPMSHHYQDAEEYAETLLRMWVMLTFYWGTGAVWPLCKHSQGAGAEGGKEAGGVREGEGARQMQCCGQPMLARGDGRKVLCTMPKRCGIGGNVVVGGGDHGSHGGVIRCGEVAHWRCSRHNHDAICNACLHHQQSVVVGSPSSATSTDIYDADIENEFSRGGTVYVCNSVKSRRETRFVPNWKSSYRLLTSALVAIVRLNERGEPLTRDKVIEWAEIVPVDDKKPYDDWKERGQGRMSFRLLNRGDCSGMPNEDDSHLMKGSKIAIIDLRVFVPEVISVLSTFAHPEFLN